MSELSSMPESVIEDAIGIIYRNTGYSPTTSRKKLAAANGNVTAVIEEFMGVVPPAPAAIKSINQALFSEMRRSSEVIAKQYRSAHPIIIEHVIDHFANEENPCNFIE